MSQLAEPDEGLRVLHLLFDHLLHHVSGVDVDGADGADALALCLGKVPQQQSDERGQLAHLEGGGGGGQGRKNSYVTAHTTVPLKKSCRTFPIIGVKLLPELQRTVVAWTHCSLNFRELWLPGHTVH